MKLITILLGLGFCWMAAGITYAMVAGDFFREAKVLFPCPWFQLTLTDLFTGIFLFCGWILYRERSLPVALVWIVLLILLGNLVSCAYALIATLKAGGDWRAFWLGSRATLSEINR